jgi:hypothetical protein
VSGAVLDPLRIDPDLAPCQEIPPFFLTNAGRTRIRKRFDERKQTFLQVTERIGSVFYKRPFRWWWRSQTSGGEVEHASID